MSARPIGIKRDVVSDLRGAIAEARDRGVKPAKMHLHLTHRDASLLKRSKEVADDEISFEGGEMRFLGVQVDIGAVAVSALTAD